LNRGPLPKRAKEKIAGKRQPVSVGAEVPYKKIFGNFTNLNSLGGDIGKKSTWVRLWEKSCKSRLKIQMDGKVPVQKSALGTRKLCGGPEFAVKGQIGRT